MNARHEELIAGYLDGALSDVEGEELLRALRSDPELVGALAEELEVHRALQFGAFRSPEGNEKAADRILQFVRATLDGADFLERVKNRALSESPSDKKTRLRSVHSLRHRRPSGPGSHVLPIAMAAGLLMGLVLIATLSRPGTVPPKSKNLTEASRRSESQEALLRAKDEAALRERARREAEERLAIIKREQDRLAETRRQAREDRQEEPLKKAEEDFARTEAEFKAAQEKLAKARDEERRAKDAVARVSPPSVPEPPKRDTQTTLPLAALERVEGQVYILGGTQRVAAKAGNTLMGGEGLETGSAGSRAVVKFQDGSRIELGGSSRIRELSDREGIENIGKRIELVGPGILTAEVAKQPEGRPLAITTPHGEATVLGTTLRIVVDPNSTRLEVTEGQVRLTRKLDGKFVDVMSGHYAVAAVGVELAVRPIPPEIITINFGAEGLSLPPGVLNDSGEEFDSKRGYGWKGPKQGREIPTGSIDPNTRKPRVVNAGRWTGYYEKEGTNPGVLRASFVFAGSIAHAETWVMPLPNGRYNLTISVGGTLYKQGPHHVAIEGVQILNKAITRAAEYLEVRDVPVEIKDGELTMVVGGFGGKPPTDPILSDADTILNYLIIKKAKAK